MTTLCTLPAREVNDKKIPETTGVLVVKQYSDVNYVVSFYTSGNAEPELSFDLDDISSISRSRKEVSTKTLFEARTFQILFSEDIEFFREVYDLASRLTSSALCLRTTTTDIAYSYSESVKQEVLKNLGPLTLRVVSPDTVLTCFYCFKSNMTRTAPDNGSPEEFKTGTFYLHPYVPRSFSGSELLFCATCLRNWEHYRCRYLPLTPAPSSDTPTGSPAVVINEDVCAICSDIAPELVICDSCPRSYCNYCLSQLLSSDEMLSLHRAKDWNCMCCAYGVPTEPGPLIVYEPIGNLQSLGLYARPSQSVEETPEIDLAVERERILFRDYVEQLLASEASIKSTYKFTQSENTCFYCKDGGKLIECEYPQCKKVYHAYCLRKQVPNQLQWHCPRHNCRRCRTRQVSLLCLFCPNSWCYRCGYSMTWKAAITKTAMIELVTTGDLNRTAESTRRVICLTCHQQYRQAFSKEIEQMLGPYQAGDLHVDDVLRPPAPQKRKHEHLVNAPTVRQQLNILLKQSKTYWTEPELSTLREALIKYPAVKEGKRALYKERYELIVNDPQFLSIAWYSYQSYQKQVSKIVSSKGRENGGQEIFRTEHDDSLDAINNPDDTIYVSDTKCISKAL